MLTAARQRSETATRPTDQALTALLRRTARGVVTFDPRAERFLNEGEPLPSAEQSAVAVARAERYVTVPGEHSPSGVANRVELTVAGFALLGGLPR